MVYITSILQFTQNSILMYYLPKLWFHILYLYFNTYFKCKYSQLINEYLFSHGGLYRWRENSLPIFWFPKLKEILTRYSRVHKSPPPFFSKILEKPSVVQKKMIPHIKGLDFSQRWSKKKFKMADLENSKWPPQKTLVFQLRQFSIFFHKNFMNWSLG